MRIILKIVLTSVVFGWLTLSSAAQAPLPVQLDPTVRPLNPNFYCYNVNMLTTDWEAPEFQQIVREIDPGLLRIPGGTVGNYWDWQAGWADHPLYADFPRNPVTLAQFKAGYDATNTQPIFALNMLTSTLERELAALRQARDLGFEITYIELGNEIDFPFREEVRVYPEPQDYATAAAEWIAAIRAEFPTAQIAVVGSSEVRQDEPRQRDWNERVMPVVEGLDVAATLHIYAGAIVDSMPAGTVYPFPAEYLNDVLGQPFTRWERVRQRDLPEIPADMPIWVTEYNSWETLDNVRLGTTWAQALFVSAMSLLMLEEPRIEIICTHAITGVPQWSSYFRASDDLQTRTANPNAPEVEPFTLTGQGMALRLFSNATADMTEAQALRFEGVPPQRTRRSGSYPALLGWLFRAPADSRQTAFIVNLSEASYHLDFNGMGFSRYTQIAANPLEQIARPDQVQRMTGDFSAALMIPPYSVTFLAR